MLTIKLIEEENIILISNEELNLENQNLTEFSLSTTLLEKLKVLLVSGNKLKSLPPEIQYYKNLVEIDLSHNNLETFPENVLLLKKLEILKINHNKFVFVPDLSNLTKLKQIIVDQIQYFHLPKTLNGKKLIVIDPISTQHHNSDEITVKIKKGNRKYPLGENFAHGDQKFLNLMNFKLKEIPPELFKFHSLETLILSRNNITILPTKIKELIKLKALAISYNRLFELPQSICQLRNLLMVHLNNNYLQQLPSDFSLLSNLELLSLESNQISQTKQLVERLSSLSNLHVLLLSNNPFDRKLDQEDFEVLSGLKSLSISNSQITDRAKKYLIEKHITLIIK